MARAWRRALTARGNPQRPAPGSKLRLVARQDVVSDGVSEAGVPAANIAASLGKLYEVELVTFADPEAFDWDALPQDGRFTVLASTSRRRYGPHARATGARPAPGPVESLPGARLRAAGPDDLRLRAAGAGGRQRLAGWRDRSRRRLPRSRLLSLRTLPDLQLR
jgi:hypothetical protein